VEYLQALYDGYEEFLKVPPLSLSLFSPLTCLYFRISLVSFPSFALITNSFAPQKRWPGWWSRSGRAFKTYTKWNSIQAKIQKKKHKGMLLLKLYSLIIMIRRGL
jgi:hypothetical protein